MDTITTKGKEKKNLIIKTWERCKSIGRHDQISSSSSSTTVPRRGLTKKSKSWPRRRLPSPPPTSVAHDCDTKSYQRSSSSRKRRVTPEGCFSVYVGPQRQRFVIKTEYANHPLFKMLLEEAELEYGFNSEGPLELPCNVDIFYKVLVEMDDDGRNEMNVRQGCNAFAQGCNAFAIASPARSYRPLSLSPLVTMNHQLLSR